MSELPKRLAVIRERIARHQGEGINEHDTKAALITPMLNALGWDVEDLDQVRREYHQQATNTRVDYALMDQGTPRLFVEAKALGTELDDLKWATQILGYASVAGVTWVVLTDGNEYRIYNAHASVPVEEKRFRKFRLTDDDAHVTEILELLARDGLRDNRLEAHWQAQFADRRLETALKGLFGPAPDESLVNLLQERTEDLTARDVAASLRRVQARFDFPVVSHSAPEAPPVPEIPDRRDSPPKPQKPQIVTLKRLVDAGIVQPPLDLHAQYKGQQFNARIEADGAVTVYGQRFRALWRATQAARVVRPVCHARAAATCGVFGASPTPTARTNRFRPCVLSTSRGADKRFPNRRAKSEPSNHLSSQSSSSRRVSFDLRSVCTRCTRARRSLPGLRLTAQ